MLGREVGPARVDLYWIPLGAGGMGFVRTNGRIYEAVTARLERRPPLDLFHTALEVQLPEGRFTIENAWPSPDADINARGVLVEGPVFSRRVARFRSLRYEVRCWQDGTIPDASEAVSSPELLSAHPMTARRLLELVAVVPPMVWGRDEAGTGEMWNSNSVVSWLITRCGLPVDSIRPPLGGRAPGWRAGVVVAGSSDRSGSRTEGFDRF